MKIIEEYINPCRSRYVKRYNELNEEQQREWDNIENLPKEKLYLKPIERKRKPEVVEGTIFALQLPEDLFMFGKVIARKHHLPMIDEEFFVVFISSKVSQEMTDYPQEFTEDNILLGPWLVSEAFWRNGTFYTVGFEELTDIEKRIDYGFYKTRYVVPKFGKGKMKDKGFIVDVNGKKIDYEPRYLEHCAYITITGIEEAIRQEIIINPKLLVDESSN